MRGERALLMNTLIRLIGTSTKIGLILYPVKVIRHFWRERYLIERLTRQEITRRYRGTYLGVLWSFLTPLLMLCIYTFVFAVVLQAKWESSITSIETTGLPYYALMLFTGLIPYSVFTEVAGRSPTLVTSVPSYVKKVVFPIEVLPLSVLGAAAVHSFISLLLLIVGVYVLLGYFSWHVLMVPLVYIPLLFMCLGMSWFLAALGVYVRDTEPTVLIAVQILFFITPIFYSDTLIPESMRWILHINPLASIVGDFRRLVIWNIGIAWYPWGRWTIVNALFALLGYAWFMKAKRGFANVL